MKIWLDEYENRKNWFTPDWIYCRWPMEVVVYLQTGTVTELSLDHDIDDTCASAAEGRKERTGYDVILWIENEVKNNGFVPPEIIIHSQNGPARDRMVKGIEMIKKYHQDNVAGEE